jgi:hypothetical protein
MSFPVLVMLQSVAEKYRKTVSLIPVEKCTPCMYVHTYPRFILFTEASTGRGNPTLRKGSSTVDECDPLSRLRSSEEAIVKRRLAAALTHAQFLQRTLEIVKLTYYTYTIWDLEPI